MTTEDLKKIDKKIRDIPYPFGENFLSFRKILADFAAQKNISAADVMVQYIAWKYYKP